MHRRTVLTAGLAVSALSLTGLPHAHAQEADRWGVTAFDHITGDPTAPVTVIEYASFDCPHCAAYHANTHKRILSDYVDPGMARFVFRHFPTNELDLRAGLVARGFEGAAFERFVDVLFATQPDWTRAENPINALLRLAATAGMSQEQFVAAANDQATADQILALRQEGQRRHQVSGTPTFAINDQVIAGNQPLDVLSRLIDDAVS